MTDSALVRSGPAGEAEADYANERRWGAAADSEEATSDSGTHATYWAERRAESRIRKTSESP